MAKQKINQEKTKLETLPETVRESAVLYQLGYSLEQIAEMRSLKVVVVLKHLIDWCEAGGEIDIIN